MKFMNMPMCDLRFITDLKKIEEIEVIQNVVLLVLPADGNEELINAIEAVPRSNVVMVMRLEKDADIRLVNGFAELGDNDFPEGKNTVVVINGTVIFRNISKDRKGGLVVNGAIIIDEKMKDDFPISILSCNGSTFFWDTDQFTNMKVYNKNFTLETDVLEYLDENSLILVGENLILEKDITNEQLKTKKISFIVGKDISCYKSNSAYVKTHSVIGNNYIINQDNE